VEQLDQEVQELEVNIILNSKYIINFCEENLKVKSDKVIDEEQTNILDNLKKNAEDFLQFQYFIIVDKYRFFCENIMTTLTEDNGLKTETSGKFFYI